MTTLYVIPAGTVCEVANVKTPDSWRHHVTRVAVACSGLVSKTRRWYVLANGAWRIKVRKKYVLEEEAGDDKVTPEQIDDPLERLYVQNEEMASDCFWRGAALQTRKEPH